jgi:hypothetical protein
MPTIPAAGAGNELGWQNQTAGLRTLRVPYGGLRKVFSYNGL